MMKYLKKGWTVYTDIDNCNLPGVRIMNAMDLSDFAPAENSAIFLDEAGILFDNRNFKNFNSGLRDFFKLQRKYKCRVFLNSQSFDIDKKFVMLQTIWVLLYLLEMFFPFIALFAVQLH